jgi:hypothetical protein
MTDRLPRVRRAAALLSIAALAAVSAVSLRADEQVAGGQTFTSRRGWFSVRVPRADTSVTGRLFTVKDAWGRGESAYEEAVFTMPGLAETYRVGIRRMGADLRLLAPGADPGQMSPAALSDVALALHYSGRVPGPVTVVQTRVLTTPHGTGMLRVNRVQGGSRLQGFVAKTDDLTSVAGAPYPGRLSGDGLVVTGVVASGMYVFYASAQNDYMGLDEISRERRVAVLEDRVRGMLDTLVVLKPLPK